ncbi:MAG: hypothetical protein AAGG01_07010, partial [Planctomycetota bacterium]
EYRIQKLDPDTGFVLARSASLGHTIRGASLTVDGAGFLYVFTPFSSATTDRLFLLDQDLREVPFPISANPGIGATGSGGLAIGGDGYLVISDVDGVTAYRAADLGVRYCDPSVPNSTGVGARLSLRGSSLLTDQDVVIRVDDLPKNSPVLLINSMEQASVPGAGGSLGILCLGGSVGRFQSSPLNSAGRGSVDLRLNLRALPQPTGAVPAMVGQRWSFQAWYRDAVGGQAVSNFSDASELLIL